MLRYFLLLKEILSLLLSHPRAMGAYDIIEALSTDDNVVKPPTVYRAIDFWVKHGFVHKVESMNAYIACCHQHGHQHAIMMICDDCQDVKEMTLK